MPGMIYIADIPAGTTLTEEKYLDVTEGDEIFLTYDSGAELKCSESGVIVGEVVSGDANKGQASARGKILKSGNFNFILTGWNKAGPGYAKAVIGSASESGEDTFTITTTDTDYSGIYDVAYTTGVDPGEMSYLPSGWQTARGFYKHINTLRWEQVRRTIVYDASTYEEVSDTKTHIQYLYGGSRDNLKTLDELRNSCATQTERFNVDRSRKDPPAFTHTKTWWCNTVQHSLSWTVKITKAPDSSGGGSGHESSGSGSGGNGAPYVTYPTETEDPQSPSEPVQEGEYYCRALVYGVIPNPVEMGASGGTVTLTAGEDATILSIATFHDWSYATGSQEISFDENTSDNARVGTARVELLLESVPLFYDRDLTEPTGTFTGEKFQTVDVDLIQDVAEAAEGGSGSSGIYIYATPVYCWSTSTEPWEWTVVVQANARFIVTSLSFEPEFALPDWLSMKWRVHGTNDEWEEVTSESAWSPDTTGEEVAIDFYIVASQNDEGEPREYTIQFQITDESIPTIHTTAFTTIEQYGTGGKNSIRYQEYYVSSTEQTLPISGTVKDGWTWRVDLSETDSWLTVGGAQSGSGDDDGAFSVELHVSAQEDYTPERSTTIKVIFESEDSSETEEVVITITQACGLGYLGTQTIEIVSEPELSFNVSGDTQTVIVATDGAGPVIDGDAWFMWQLYAAELVGAGKGDDGRTYWTFEIDFFYNEEGKKLSGEYRFYLPREYGGASARGTWTQDWVERDSGGNPILTQLRTFIAGIFENRKRWKFFGRKWSK